MRVLLAPHGTRGDVQPMLALALALQARRHVVGFVAPDNFVEWIRSHGFEAEPNGIDVEQMMRSADARLDSARWQIRHLSDVLIPQLFVSVARAMPDADLIVGAGVQLAAPSVAEARDVPFCTVAFCPCAVPSAETPPPPIRNQRLPRVINQLLWQVGGPITSWMIARPINAGRQRLGLRPIGSVLDDLFHQPVIVAADRDLGPIPADVPRTVVATDAFVLQSTVPIDPRVAAFLAIDPAPVYVGFGSMVARRLPELAAHAAAAARALGRRLLLAGGWAALDRHMIAEDAGDPGDDVLLVDAVPHAAVLPRVAAAVHHGGAGTTTAAARAGVPQVILPHILDQYYWAHRVERLGLGPRALPVDLVTADVLTERLDAALNDPRIRRRAAEAAPPIAARNGVDAAVDHLERIAGSWSG